MAITTITDMSALESMITSGIREEAEGAKRIATLTENITKAEAELVTMAQSRERKDQQVAQAKIASRQAHLDATMQASRAKLAIGTTIAQQAIKAATTAKKNANASEKEVQRLQSEQSELQTMAQAREQELQQAITDMLSERQALEEQREAVQRAIVDARREVGC